MSLRKHVSGDEKTVTITIDGMFDLSLQGDFRKAYEEYGKQMRYVIDLRDTDYMDSSAFGMLLVFKNGCAILVMEVRRVFFHSPSRSFPLHPPGWYGLRRRVGSTCCV